MDDWNMYDVDLTTMVMKDGIAAARLTMVLTLKLTNLFSHPVSYLKKVRTTLCSFYITLVSPE